MPERNVMILGDLVAVRAEEKPDLDVVTFERSDSARSAQPDEIRTYADLHENANRIAAGLVARGFEHGDRFGLMMRNHPEFVETMIAASVTGCVFVPIDPRTRGDKLAYTLQNAGWRGVVCADYCLEQIDEVRRKVPSLDRVLVLEEQPSAVDLSAFRGVEPLRELLAKPAPTVN